MMKYEIFKDAVTNKFLDYLPEKYRNAMIIVGPVQKVNTTLDSISIKMPNVKVSPTVYINNMYEQYQENGDFDETLSRTGASFADAFEQMSTIDFDSILRDVKDKVVFQLINTRQNQEFLKNLPHRDFLDLSIVYKIVVQIDQDGIQSTYVTNKIADAVELDEGQLFKYAAENTRKLFPPQVHNIKEIMKRMYLEKGFPEGFADMMLEAIDDGPFMWVISNFNYNMGAASMLYEDVLFEMAERLKSDLYILPSSVNEVIAVAADFCDPENLAQMVADINMSSVLLEERLSNQVYFYDRNLRKLSLATDTPNKTLDGEVA